MPPSFYSSACPVFAVAWLGNRAKETDAPAHVLYSGGGGSTKSGVKNQIVVANVKQSETEGGAPTFNEISTVETGERICSTFHVDAVRENNKAQLAAMGMGDMFMIYGITSKYKLIPVSSGAEFKGKKENTKADVKTITFDRKNGNVVATGDDEGIIRIIKLQNTEKVLKALAKGSPKDLNSFPQIKFDEKVNEIIGHRDAITSLHFNSTGKQLCSGSKDGTCRIWDVASGQELCVLPATSGLPPAYTKNKQVLKQMCRVAFFSGDDTSVYTLQNAARGVSYATKWSLSQKEGDNGSDNSKKKKEKKNKADKPITQIDFSPMKTKEVANIPITTMELSPCSNYLVMGDTRGCVAVYYADSLKKMKVYEGHQLPVSSITVSNPHPQSKLSHCSILTGSGDKTIIIGSLRNENASGSSIMTFFCVLLMLLIIFLAFFAPQLIEDAIMKTLKS